MTAATLRQSLAQHRLWWAVAGAVAALLVAAALFAPRGMVRAETPSALIAPAQAAALVRATSGDAALAVKAVGADAQLINASIPFDSSPVAAARPFDMAGGDLDHRRALLCLTQAVYYEAANEPLEGRRAVAQVVLNRMRHPAYPKSVCGVVYQRNSTPVCQFTFVCDGALLRQPIASKWNEAREVAAAALAGYVERSVGSATHYHADYVAPRWAPLLAKVAKLGAHIFYRWPGAWGMPAAFTGRYIGEPNDPLSLRPVIRPSMLATVVPEDLAKPVTGPVTDGTLLKRAPNDVGGLLDTSKGWTLNIPDPTEASRAARAVADSQARDPQPAAATAVATLAAR
jgi:spore germination cell wall hydrolase CwlJ-like protein